MSVLSAPELQVQGASSWAGGSAGPAGQGWPEQAWGGSHPALCGRVSVLKDRGIIFSAQPRQRVDEVISVAHPGRNKVMP